MALAAARRKASGMEIIVTARGRRKLSRWESSFESCARGDVRVLSLSGQLQIFCIRCASAITGMSAVLLMRRRVYSPAAQLILRREEVLEGMRPQLGTYRPCRQLTEVGVKPTFGDPQLTSPQAQVSNG